MCLVQEQQEHKKQEQLQKKQEARLLLEQENENLKATLTPAQQTAKLTRAQIQAHADKIAEKG